MRVAHLLRFLQGEIVLIRGVGLGIKAEVGSNSSGSLSISVVGATRFDAVKRLSAISCAAECLISHVVLNEKFNFNYYYIIQNKI